MKPPKMIKQKQQQKQWQQLFTFIVRPLITVQLVTVNLLIVLTTRAVTYGSKSHFSAAPRLWNILSESIRVSPTMDAFLRRSSKHIF